MIRLTEARARADLRTTATAADARDVIELMQFSLRDLFRDSVPFVHVPATGKGVKNEAKRLMEALRGMKRAQGTDRATVDELTALGRDLGLSADVLGVVDMLNEAGELLKKGPQLYGW